MGALELFCTWPFHMSRDGQDMEALGCPTCLWWSIVYWLSVADAPVIPPMSRKDPEST